MVYISFFQQIKEWEEREEQREQQLKLWEQQRAQREEQQLLWEKQQQIQWWERQQWDRQFYELSSLASYRKNVVLDKVRKTNELKKNVDIDDLKRYISQHSHIDYNSYHKKDDGLLFGALLEPSDFKRGKYFKGEPIFVDYEDSEMKAHKNSLKNLHQSIHEQLPKELPDKFHSRTTLVAYGAQDVYLTGNPQITFFKQVHISHVVVNGKSKILLMH